MADDLNGNVLYHSFKIKGVTRVSRETTAGPQLRQTHIKVKKKDIFLLSIN